MSEWWDKPGMDVDVDNGAWILHQAAEYLPSKWKHIVSSASSLVLCANRQDTDGVKQYLGEIAERVALPPPPNNAKVAGSATNTEK